MPSTWYRSSSLAFLKSKKFILNHLNGKKFDGIWTEVGKRREGFGLVQIAHWWLTGAALSLSGRGLRVVPSQLRPGEHGVFTKAQVCFHENGPECVNFSYILLGESS